MQQQPPDMLISMMPFFLIYGGISAFALRKRAGEVDRKNGWRRWRWMTATVFGAVILSILTIWWKGSGS
jgi:hypothetical protein